jgi:hypothetical protein
MHDTVSSCITSDALKQAFNPIVIKLTVNHCSGIVFPRVLATKKVLPDADGVGFSSSISMRSLLSRI